MAAVTQDGTALMYAAETMKHSLDDLMEGIRQMLSSRVLENTHVYSQLRLARTALTVP